MPDSLDQADFEQIVRLLNEVLNPLSKRSVPERRRQLMAGLCRLVDAEVWMWSNCIANPDKPGDLFTTCFLEGGWQSPEEQIRAYELLTSPAFGTRYFRKIYELWTERYVGTVHGRDLIPAHEYESFQAEWSATGLEYCLYSFYPLGACRASNSGIHRKIGKPEFAERDRLIVDTVLRHVDSLHRYGDNEGEYETSINLSQRERMTLVLLLSGLSHKAIADRLGISQHTVNDYVKALHRRYGVSSRAELQAKFFLGGHADLDGVAQPG